MCFIKRTTRHHLDSACKMCWQHQQPSLLVDTALRVELHVCKHRCKTQLCYRGGQHHMSDCSCKPRRLSHIEVWPRQAWRGDYTVIILMKRTEARRVTVYNTFPTALRNVLANHSCSKKALTSSQAMWNNKVCWGILCPMLYKSFTKHHVFFFSL